MKDEFMVIAQRNYVRTQKQQKSIKGRVIKWLIDFGQAVENDTLAIKDALPVFLIGALICHMTITMWFFIIQSSLMRAFKKRGGQLGGAREKKG